MTTAKETAEREDEMDGEADIASHTPADVHFTK
jgi:hypothetical protein